MTLNWLRASLTKWGSPASCKSPTVLVVGDDRLQYPGCLGPLRSLIAQGELAGVGPFGRHFTGEVNPGAHQGMVGEEEFLANVLGITDLAGWSVQVIGK